MGGNRKLSIFAGGEKGAYRKKRGLYKIYLERYATQISKRVNGLNLVETLFLISIEAFLDVKIISMGP